MIGSEPEHQKNPVASRPRIARVLCNQLVFDGTPQILAVGLLHFHNDGVGTADRQDVRSDVLRMMPFRLGIDLQRFQRDLKV